LQKTKEDGKGDRQNQLLTNCGVKGGGKVSKGNNRLGVVNETGGSVPSMGDSIKYQTGAKLKRRGSEKNRGLRIKVANNGESLSKERRRQREKQTKGEEEGKRGNTKEPLVYIEVKEWSTSSVI